MSSDDAETSPAETKKRVRPEVWLGVGVVIVSAVAVIAHFASNDAPVSSASSSPSAEPSLVLSTTPIETPSELASLTPPISPNVQKWIDQMNAAGQGSSWGAADAEFACESLKNPEAAWDAVSDIRMRLAAKLVCTQYAAIGRKAEGGIPPGGSGTSYTITTEPGEGNVAPGTYVTRPKMDSCYWALLDSSAKTIDNGFVHPVPATGVTIIVPATAASLTLKSCGAAIRKP